MADIEARPAKIRKLDFSEGTESYRRSPSAPLDLDEKNGCEEPGAMPKDDSNDAPHVETQGIGEGRPPLSKNQLKKLLKQEQWIAGKEYRRTKRREKHKEKQARKAVAAQEAGNSGVEVPETVPVKDIKQSPRRPIPVPVTLIIDCDFNELMTEKERISLGAQLTRCYSDNKSSTYRSHMVISSWGGKLQTRFETVLASNHLKWKGVRFLESNFQVAAQELDVVMRGPEGGKLVGALSEGKKPLSDESESATLEEGTEPSAVENKATELLQEKPSPSIVYLTSDSPNTLDRLYPHTSYIIGGIVDKNRHKGICYKRACERGIPTAKLPIGEYMTMQSRSVLAVNHVVEIMLKWLETGNWGEAFLSVIPKRKEAKLKGNKDGSAEGGETVAEGEDAEGEAEFEGGEPEGIAETAVPADQSISENV